VSVFKGFQRFRKLTAGNCLHAPNVARYQLRYIPFQLL